MGPFVVARRPDNEHHFAKTKRIECRSLSGPDFLWLVLQHVLPKGFRRARTPRVLLRFGFASPQGETSVSAPQLQAADRFAACGTEVRSGSGAGLGQGTAIVPVRMLRGGDGDCENANSVGDREAHAGAYCHSGGALTL